MLVGTQMIAKGHDFPRVTLVGVISADVGLGLADFRAGERTFQLLTQVAGRAGRGERAGEAIVQTLYPEHYSIQLACRQDYPGFFETRARLSPRHALSAGRRAGQRGGARTSFDEAMQTATDIVPRLEPSAGDAEFHDPWPRAGAARRLRGEHRVQFFLKGPPRRHAQRAARDAGRDARDATDGTIDVDPLNVTCRPA